MPRKYDEETRVKGGVQLSGVNEGVALSVSLPG